MASFTQGEPLENITTSQSQTTTAPEWYTDYLKNLSTSATSAGAGAQFVGPTNLQNQAFQNVAANVGNYQPLLNQAVGQVNQAGNMSAYGAGAGALNQALGMSGAQAGAGALNQSMGLSGLSAGYPAFSQSMGMSGAGAAAPALNQSMAMSGANAANPAFAQSMGMSGANAAANYLNQSAGMSGAQAGQAGINAAMQTAPSNIAQYMNPYTSSVVDEMTRLGQQNIRQNLAPQSTAGIVGAGQFGSQRGAQALGQNITNALQDLGGRQATALQSGYTQALGASQADMARQLQAGVAAGQLTAADAARLAQIGQTQGQLTEAQATRLAQIGQMQGQLTGADAARLAQIGQTQGQLTEAQASRLAQLGQMQGQLTESQASRLAQTGQIQGQLTAADAARLAQIGQMQGQLTQADIDARLRGAQQYGALSGQAQSMGLADVNALSTLGAQQQQIAQNQQLFPLQIAEKQAALMKGYTVPTSVSSSYTGPIPGAYQTSPLAMLSAFGSGAAGLFSSPSGGGNTPWQNLVTGIKDLFD